MEYGYTSRDKNGNPRTGANVDELLQKIEDLENATHETAGLMSAADKVKLDAQEASPSIVGMRWTRQNNVWDFGGHTFSELQGYNTAGVLVVVQIVTEEDANFYELVGAGLLLPMYNSNEFDTGLSAYTIMEGSSDSIVIDEITYQNAIKAHNATNLVSRDKRKVTLYGDKVINESVVPVSSVVVDENGVSINAVSYGVTAKYNGSEIATEASIEGGYFAS